MALKRHGCIDQSHFNGVQRLPTLRGGVGSYRSLPSLPLPCPPHTSRLPPPDSSTAAPRNWTMLGWESRHIMRTSAQTPRHWEEGRLAIREAVSQRQVSSQRGSGQLGQVGSQQPGSCPLLGALCCPSRRICSSSPSAALSCRRSCCEKTPSKKQLETLREVQYRAGLDTFVRKSKMKVQRLPYNKPLMPKAALKLACSEVARRTVLPMERSALPQNKALIPKKKKKP